MKVEQKLRGNRIVRIIVAVLMLIGLACLIAEIIESGEDRGRLITKAIPLFIVFAAAFISYFFPTVRGEMGKGDFEDRMYADLDRATCAALDNEKKAKGKMLKGYIFWQKNDHSSAVTYYRAAFKAAESPKVKSAAKVFEGICLNELKKKREARECFKLATELDPSCDRAWYKLGMFYEELGDDDEALYAYKACVMKNPRNSYGYNQLGLFYYTRNDWENAVKNYTMAVKFNPKNSIMHSNLAMALASNGDIEEAREEYKAAIALGYNDEGDYKKNTIERMAQLKASGELYAEDEYDDDFEYVSYNEED